MLPKRFEYVSQGMKFNTTDTVNSTTAVDAASASISSLLSVAVEVPSSVLTELTKVPTNVAAAITEPAVISSLIADFASSLPEWYTSLSPAAQSYVINVGPKLVNVQPEIERLESLIASQITVNATIITTTVMSNATITVQAGTNITMGGNSTMALSTATSVMYVNSTVSAKLLSRTTSTVVATAEHNPQTTLTSAMSSSSTAGVAKQSGYVAAGLLGALGGVLGLAVAL